MPYKISHEHVADKPEREIKRKMAQNDLLKLETGGISKKGQGAKANIGKELHET